jgi:Flp pilus assembly pilin Flp
MKFGVCSMLWRQLRLDRSGSAALEYAMVAFFVSIAAFSVIVMVGADVSGMFSRIANGF